MSLKAEEGLESTRVRADSPLSTGSTATTSCSESEEEESIWQREERRLQSEATRRTELLALWDASSIEKTDRLSSLPSELLDNIFDFAYTPEDRPEGPLSKQLLPFYFRGLYRRIETTWALEFEELARRIISAPLVGELVKDLNVKAQYQWEPAPLVFSSQEIFEFWSKLSTVKRIQFIPGNRPEYSVRPTSTSSARPHLPHLVELSVPSPFVGKNPLAFFNSFTRLESLTVEDYESNDQEVYLYPASDLPYLTHLKVSGPSADDPSIADFAKSCPRLSNLTLSCRKPRYEPLLLRLRTDIPFLDLESANDVDNHFSIDHVLPRFTKLRDLCLGQNLTSTTFPKSIKGHLKELESFSVQVGPVSASELVKLIQESNRLRTVHLDKYRGDYGGEFYIGKRSKVLEIWPEDLPEYDDDEEPGYWELPGFSDQPGDWSVEDAERVLDAAEAAGVEITGGLDLAVREHRDFYRAVANLAIIRTYRDREFSHYENIRRQEYYNLRLPHLDFDKLDLENLQLVRLYSEVDKLHYLTLENRDEVSTTERDHGQVIKVDFRDGKGPR